MQQIRQGDVILIKVNKAPVDNGQVIDRIEGRIIVAEGEATGHAHAIPTPEVDMLEKENIRWLVAPEEFMLEHEEHDTITLDPGIWQVVYQREYDPQQIRRVMD